jgi:serine/threonine protein kinase
VNNKPKDERTDIWQMGVILYELATGTLPFKGDSIVELAVNISTKPYTPPSKLNLATREIEPIIGMCLQKDPDKRFQTVTALQRALGIYLRHNYAELFKQSVTAHDIRRSAYYVGDLIIVNLIIGDLPAAYKYSTDLVEYAKGDAKALAQEFSEQLYLRIENNVTEVPDELIKKAEFVVHKVLMGFRVR